MQAYWVCVFFTITTRQPGFLDSWPDTFFIFIHVYQVTLSLSLSERCGTHTHTHKNNINTIKRGHTIAIVIFIHHPPRIALKPMLREQCNAVGPPFCTRDTHLARLVRHDVHRRNEEPRGPTQASNRQIRPTNLQSPNSTHQ